MFLWGCSLPIPSFLSMECNLLEPGYCQSPEAISHVLLCPRSDPAIAYRPAQSLLEGENFQGCLPLPKALKGNLWGEAMAFSASACEIRGILSNATCMNIRRGKALESPKNSSIFLSFSFKAKETYRKMDPIPSIISLSFLYAFPEQKRKIIGGWIYF